MLRLCVACGDVQFELALPPRDRNLTDLNVFIGELECRRHPPSTVTRAVANDCNPDRCWVSLVTTCPSVGPRIEAAGSPCPVSRSPAHQNDRGSDGLRSSSRRPVRGSARGEPIGASNLRLPANSKPGPRPIAHLTAVGTAVNSSPALMTSWMRNMPMKAGGSLRRPGSTPLSRDGSRMEFVEGDMPGASQSSDEHGGTGRLPYPTGQFPVGRAVSGSLTQCAPRSTPTIRPTKANW